MPSDRWTHHIEEEKTKNKIHMRSIACIVSTNAAIATQFEAYNIEFTRSISKEDWTYFKLLIHKNLHYFQVENFNVSR